MWISCCLRLPRIRNNPLSIPSYSPIALRHITIQRMHSTLRTELRGTQRVFELLRPRPNKSFKSRAFSHRSSLRDQNTPTNTSGSENIRDQGTKDPNHGSSSVKSRAVELGVEIEQWINQLSKSGQSLHVWDTISEQDENGNWRLLPHVKNDLEDVGRWATNHDNQKQKPFGLKIEDGRVRPLTSQELRKEQESGRKKGVLQEIQAVRAASSSSLDHTPSKVEDTTSDKAGEELRLPRKEPEQSSRQEHATGGDVPTEEADIPVTKFYGSSAARRQRSLKSKEKSVVYILPSWFHKRNVLLRGEKQLDPSLPAQVTPTSDKRSKASKLALVMPRPDLISSSTHGSISHADEQESKTIAAMLGTAAMASAPTGSSDVSTSVFSSVDAAEEKIVLAAVDTVEKSDQVMVDKSDQIQEKKQIQAPGGDNTPGPNGPSAPKSPASTRRSPILIPLPDTNRRYFIEEAQHNELMMTVKGKLRPPPSGSIHNQPRGLRDHLIIHHTAVGAETYLDRLVEDVARKLECDLITLDAQDIVDLISRPKVSGHKVDPLLVNEAKTMSYDVYKEIYRDGNAAQDIAAMTFAEEAEEGEDENEGPMPPMLGGWKPVTIDLHALFNPRGPRRQTPPFMPKHFWSEGTAAGSAKSSNGIFFGMIDSVLTSAKNKRTASQSSTEKEDETQEHATDTKESATNSTIVHIKDLKSIQYTNIGKQFLNQLYEQVELLREAGQSIMLVGTESAHADDSTYDKPRIRNLQDANPDEISTTMVLTPAHPDETNRDFLVDRVRRRSIINARHLWATLQSKNLSIGPLKPGFWTRDFIESLSLADQLALNEGLWSFSHVQRLAAVLASEDVSKSKQPIGEASATIRLSDKSKFAWAEQTKQGVRSTEKDEKDPEQERDQAGKDRLARIREKANKHEKKLLGGVVEPKKIATTFKDIHIPAETVEALQTLTTLSLVRPDAFRYGVLASDRIPGLLLYGPPGTGKTLAAKAVARESGATMLEVSAADINDMYVGEGEKNVKALFSLARKLSPCVVFLDEADAMFSSRSNEGRRVSHRELINQFLREWDGMSNDSGSAFIMVATNRPMDLDDAVLRRLPRRVLVDLPTETDRLEILKIHLRHEQVASDVNLSQLATKTPFYSGSDLKNVAVAAALNAVREENEHANNATEDEPYQYPAKRTLTAKHFEKALEEISASISEDMSSLRAIKKFDEQYGDKKGRKKKQAKWGFRSAAEADQVLDTVKVRS